MSFTVARQALQAKERLSTEKSQCDKTVDIPDHLHGDHAIADFRNAFMNAIGNHLLSSLVKTPLARDREIAFINAMTARRGFYIT
jgi:hypothetical protein